jgi:hypothetical protein
MEGKIIETVKADGRIYCVLLYTIFVSQKVKAHKSLLFFT